MTTEHQSHYWAWCLEALAPADTVLGLSRSLANARLDLNPHQVDAALFALRSSLSKGVLLADEVGLGKTVEAGLVIAQRWAERRRRVLVIVPATLRAQWAAELESKFFLPTRLLDGRSYRALERSQAGSPWDAPGQVIICSYAFAARHAVAVGREPWDLCVIDEAHRLRNVWQAGARTARALREATSAAQKLLLTATPLQNNLMELFGLVAFIDEHVFGDEASFRELFLRNPDFATRDVELARRIAPLCQRTLRRQVREYVRFTARRPLTGEFVASSGEQVLYDAMTAYLARPRLYALPSAQRQLMTLVLRKLLASSSQAIAPTLAKLTARLERALSSVASDPGEPDAAEPDATGPGVGESDELFEGDFEELDELADEWDEVADTVQVDAPAAATATRQVDLATREEMEAELAELRGLAELAARIGQNAKATALLAALEVALAYATGLGARPKAVIFTESRRTQAMLAALLESSGYAGRVVVLNGSNNDVRSTELLAAWRVRHAGDGIVTGSRAVDTKAAVVEAFAADADILVATEAAAEGVNLQFCSLVVNYDLPWNPQRVEQRIGRCHRYGQAHDVVVLNMIDLANAADQRVLQLLSEKLRLFDGLFGSSDEVLGAIGSGIDLERRIASVYQGCRTSEEIHAAFDALQADLEEQIRDRMAATRQAVLEHFDADVQARLHVHHDAAQQALGWRERLLLAVLRHELRDAATFDPDVPRLHYHGEAGGDPAWTGTWNLVWRDADRQGEHFLRPDDPFARFVLQRAMERVPEPATLRFDVSHHPTKIAALEPLVGSSGWLAVDMLHVEALQREDHLLLAGAADDGRVLDAEACNQLLGVAAEAVAECDGDAVNAASAAPLALAAAHARADIEARNGRQLDAEIDKLDRWADDLKTGIERELRELDAAISDARRRSREAPALADKLRVQQEIQTFEQRRTQKRRRIFEEQDAIDARRNVLIENLQQQLDIQTQRRTLLRLRWEIV